VSKTSVFKMFGSGTEAIIQVLWCYVNEKLLSLCNCVEVKITLLPMVLDSGLY